MSKVNSQEIKKEKQENFKERIWFIKYWANYIKSHSDREWSEQQAGLIDSQFDKSKNKA